MMDGGGDAPVRENSSLLKDTGLCCGARQHQSHMPSSDSPCCIARTRAEVSLCPGAAVSASSAASSCPGASDGRRPGTSRTCHAGGLPCFNRICRLAI